MSSATWPPQGGPPGPAAPMLPPGWLANWSPDHNAWYYVFTATGATQWEYPTPPPDQLPCSPPPEYQPPLSDQPLHTPTPDGTDEHIQDGDRGLGKAALALGSGFLAGKAFGGKTEGHNSNNGFGKVTQSIAMAGAGAIGSKIFGLFGNKPQNQPASPAPQTQVHVYPVYVPGPQGSPHPVPQGPPMYHGQPPAVGQNFGPMGAGGGMGAVPGMAPTPAPYHEGQPSNAGWMGSSVSPSAPPLYIHGAVFADKDVTQVIRGLVTPQQTLMLKGEKLVEQLGDPWPEVGRKMFNVLYSYGDRPMELIAADTGTGNIEIKHEAISKKRMEYCQPPPSRIIACLWGLDNALTKPRLEQLEKDGELEGTSDALGGGSFYGWEPKTLVCYYRTDMGGIATMFCRDGGTIRLPWNPLAKWS